ncbi:MAG: hypothetical protein AAGI03_13515, partial [Pseudomonadota bacterium]
MQHIPTLIARFTHHVTAEILARLGQVDGLDVDPAIPGDFDGQPTKAVAGLDHAAGPAHECAQAQPQDRPEHRVHPGEGIT